MVDNNRGSSPLGRGDDESVLDSSGTQADAVLLFDLVHSPSPYLVFPELSVAVWLGWKLEECIQQTQL